MKYNVVDLFAGAGGLSLGFEQTGCFDIKVAFEKSIGAQKTYIKNHPNVEMHDDVCQADYEDIVSRFGTIDVVIGGPPCQGFSNANRQKNHVISMNNMLIKQYIRAIVELEPKAFVLENVGMLKSDVHRFYMEQNDGDMIKKYEIHTTNDELHLLDANYNFESAIDIIQDSLRINANLWTADEYATINIISKLKNNKAKLEKTLEKYKSKLLSISQRFLIDSDGDEFVLNLKYQIGEAIQSYFDKEIKSNSLLVQLEQPILVQRMLSKAKEIIDNNILVDDYCNEDGVMLRVRSYTVYEYISKVLGFGENGYLITSGILNAADFGAPQKRMRFVAIGYKKSIATNIDLPKGNITSKDYSTVRDAISDIEFETPNYDVKNDSGIHLENDHPNISSLGKELRDSKILYNHIITKNKEIALKRFGQLKQGQNFHDLHSSMKENTYSDISRTQNTIYLRLNYDEPSGTVVNVRKSMWVHPVHDRAISVREAARLQTFPDSFVFEGGKDSQYQQVGNAVPPKLAKSIAISVKNILEK